MISPRLRSIALAATALLAGLLAPETAPAESAGDRVVVAARPLRAGVVLSREDVATIAGRLRPPFIGEVEKVVGLETRIALYQGRPIRAVDLGPPTVVKRNQVVTMVFKRGALSLRTEGRALDRGAVGERVRILNLDSRRTVFATVVGPARVEAK